MNYQKFEELQKTSTRFQTDAEKECAKDTICFLKGAITIIESKM